MTLAEITTNGIVGDRIVHVRGPEGVRTSRRHHNLIGLHATLGPDGEPLADGLPWALPEVLERVRAAAGPDAMLARYDGPERFDGRNCTTVSRRPMPSAVMRMLPSNAFAKARNFVRGSTARRSTSTAGNANAAL